MLTKKVPIYFLFVIIGFFTLIICSGLLLLHNKEVDKKQDVVQNQLQENVDCGIEADRLKGYQYVGPLLYSGPTCESIDFASKKNEVENVINAKKASGEIIAASVYIRDLNKLKWCAINESELYNPGSIMKLPELMAFYKMNENNPGVLDKTITYNLKSNESRTINFDSKHIEIGKSYKVSELLEYMIVYSDNEATKLLNSIIDRNIFSKIFTDLGLKTPDYNAGSYPISVKDCSLFLRVLYNATYINLKDSEACLKLLSKSTFEKGIRKGLPSGLMISHKFGEAGSVDEPNLSESALIYGEKGPFILTIMTKGKDITKLTDVISAISNAVYKSYIEKS